VKNGDILTDFKTYFFEYFDISVGVTTSTGEGAAACPTACPGFIAATPRARIMGVEAPTR
jgi:hypothetical protein